jgi:hypothetical protein
LQKSEHIRAIRLWLSFFIAGLIVSGVTAFALEAEPRWFLLVLSTGPMRQPAEYTHLLPWITRVYEGVSMTNTHYPFLAYGTDWLAFAHLVIAVAFLGPYRDPARNKWIITFGLVACAGVIPLALIAGPIRGIPVGWRIIDCSFGVIGAIPLLLCRWHILALESLEQARIFLRAPSV